MSSSADRRFDADDRFMFDLNGYMVLRNVFSPDEISQMNAVVDRRKASVVYREAAKLKNASASGSYAGASAAAQHSRGDLGGILQEKIFRSVLTHPRLVPYYTALLGKGFRMDHQPFVIVQSKDSEGFSLHGGPVGGADHCPIPELQYHCQNGHILNSLLAVSVALADAPENSGGYCVVPGSHKLNFSMPTDFAEGSSERGRQFFQEHVRQPVLKKGDVVLFSEATIHGAMPWKGAHERRVALYRFAPANFGYGRMYLGERRQARKVEERDKSDFSPPNRAGSGSSTSSSRPAGEGYIIPKDSEWHEGPFGLNWDELSGAERAVLQPPYAVRTERPCVIVDADSGSAEGVVKVTFDTRTQEKKDHDFKMEVLKLIR
eukprot:g8477.t1